MITEFKYIHMSFSLGWLKPKQKRKRQDFRNKCDLSVWIQDDKHTIKNNIYILFSFVNISMIFFMIVFKQYLHFGWKLKSHIIEMPYMKLLDQDFSIRALTLNNHNHNNHNPDHKQVMQCRKKIL